MNSVREFYTANVDRYRFFNTAFQYQHALEAFFLSYDRLRPGFRVLDAGCGTGTATLALLRALRRRGFNHEVIHAFDLTPAMLACFQDQLDRAHPAHVEIREGDILNTSELPSTWTGHDLIMTSGLLEHLPKGELPDVLSAMRNRLRVGGWILLFVTRKNWVNRLVIEDWWRGNAFSAGELQEGLQAAGCQNIRFLKFPNVYVCQNLWGHVIEGQRGGHGHHDFTPLPFDR
jgi:SAM-dependent methyltransferase